MRPNYPKRLLYSKAQGMVEFALVMPILLFVVYGIFEVGRVLFMYSIVATANHEALRYGSSTGLNTVGGPERYQDCDGIRAAADHVDFLGVIEEGNIVVVYDHGPGSEPFAVCPPTAMQQLSTGDRIVVQVSADFIPIVPIIPWAPWTITSSGARTLLLDIQVAGTIQPPQLSTYTPSQTPTPTETPTPTFTPSNTPTITETSMYSPTPSATPTITPTPTQTGTPTDTPLPTNTSLPIDTMTPTATPFTCNVKHNGPPGGGQDVTWTIYNNHTIPVEVNLITIYWDSSGNRFLNEVRFNNQIVFSGTSKDSPRFFWGSWSLPGAQVPPGVSTIRLVFAKSTTNIRIQLNLVPPQCTTLDSSNSSQIQSE